MKTYTGITQSPIKEGMTLKVKSAAKIDFIWDLSVTWKNFPFSVETLVGCQRLRICAGDREPEHPRARAAEVFWGIKGHWNPQKHPKTNEL